MPDSASQHAEAPAAIVFDRVTKVYRAYEGLFDQALDVFGLAWLKRGPLRYKEIRALNGVDLQVGRGERVAIVGRNGAGKTTLLKLVTQNFSPTTGRVEVNGSIQALMNVGLGFHSELTGEENVRSSMLYNGLAEEEFEAAYRDVVEFVELGDFLQQPVKSYSLGMKARLMFATATAIRPDILIVDEVLGAGDAYFAGKSAARMESLVSSGCTVLLVSHSTQQVLQYCETAVWLEGGKVVMRDDALAVVNAYEEFIHSLEKQRGHDAVQAKDGNCLDRSVPDGWLDRRILNQVLQRKHDAAYTGGRLTTASGGVSRWEGEGSLEITSVHFLDESGAEARRFKTGGRLRLEMEVTAKTSGIHPCRFVAMAFDSAGRVMSRFVSDERQLALAEKEACTTCLEIEPLAFGSGEYYWSIAAYRVLDLENLAGARYYDLLARSFRIEVVSALRDDPSQFHQAHRWQEEGEPC